MKVSKKFVKLGTNADEISGSDIPANFSASNYTATSSDIAGHLEGIDNSLSSQPGDIAHTSFSLANNQSTFTNVTGISFANGTVRSAEIQYSIYIDATSSLYESGKIMAVQRGADWVISQSLNGDNSLVLFNINSSGQLQYKSGNYSGYNSGTLKIRAITTSI